LPEIEFNAGSPRMWVGKCPSTLTPHDHVRLVNEAIPGGNGDRDLPFPKKLYVVHDGVIYEAQTTDRGKSYHGYPYHGKLTRRIRRALQAMAEQKGCVNRFDHWVNEHIEGHGA
jgi:hypothetical protein